MRQAVNIEHAFLKIPSLHIAYRIYKYPEIKTTRRLLCLHGAGVAGELTYGFILPFLNKWSEVLVPDLRGMGETFYRDGEEREYDILDLVGDQTALLKELEWDRFDLCGYSLGGLVAMLLKAQIKNKVDKTYLIEPALLDHKKISETRLFRHRYRDVAQELLLLENKERALTDFLDLVSPNRIKNPVSEAMVVSRLGHRPIGFARALNAVSYAVDSVDREALLAAQADVISFVGGKSYQHMRDYHAYLSSLRADWQYIEVPGADHSLPFQKPKRVIKALNESVC